MRRPGAVSFLYEPDYRRAGGPPVAFTLSFSDDPIDGVSPGAVPPFFAGLLPEGRRLGALRRAVKTSADDELPRRCSRQGVRPDRFDRVSASDGVWVPRAQEDACQVLGRYPADKYQLTTEAVVSALAHVCRSRPVAGRTLLQQVVFAYLTCNGDAHAKNFSVLHTGEWKVAPAYDLPSSHPYGDHTLALSIGDKTREDVGRSDLLELAATVGVPARAAGKTIDALLDASDAWVPQLDHLPFDDRTIHKLREAIDYRRTRLLGSG